MRQIALVATESANLRFGFMTEHLSTRNMNIEHFQHNLKNNTTDKTFSLVVCTIMYQF